MAPHWVVGCCWFVLQVGLLGKKGGHVIASAKIKALSKERAIVFTQDCVVGQVLQTIVQNGPKTFHVCAVISLSDRSMLLGKAFPTGRRVARA